ncbi:MAG: hypothetical protein AB7F43_11710 [Bacteriovoracia bacterium]
MLDTSKKNIEIALKPPTIFYALFFWLGRVSKYSLKDALTCKSVILLIEQIEKTYKVNNSDLCLVTFRRNELLEQALVSQDSISCETSQNISQFAVWFGQSELLKYIFLRSVTIRCLGLVLIFDLFFVALEVLLRSASSDFSEYLILYRTINVSILFLIFFIYPGLRFFRKKQSLDLVLVRNIEKAEAIGLLAAGTLSFVIYFLPWVFDRF